SSGLLVAVHEGTHLGQRTPPIKVLEHGGGEVVVGEVHGEHLDLAGVGSEDRLELVMGLHDSVLVTLAGQGDLHGVHHQLSSLVNASMSLSVTSGKQSRHPPLYRM